MGSFDNALHARRSSGSCQLDRLLDNYFGTGLQRHSAHRHSLRWLVHHHANLWPRWHIAVQQPAPRSCGNHQHHECQLSDRRLHHGARGADHCARHGRQFAGHCHLDGAGEQRRVCHHFLHRHFQPGSTNVHIGYDVMRSHRSDWWNGLHIHGARDERRGNLCRFDSIPINHDKCSAERADECQPHSRQCQRHSVMDCICC